MNASIQRERADRGKMEAVKGRNVGPIASLLATLRRFRQRSAKHNSDGLPFDVSGWALRGYLDVLCTPVRVIVSPEGREVAHHYSSASKRPVRIEWQRARGVEIDHQRFRGVLMSMRLMNSMPCVTFG